MSILEQIDIVERSIKASKGRIILHAQNPSDNYHWSARVCEADREDWLILISLARKAAELAEVLQKRKAEQ